MGGRDVGAGRLSKRCRSANVSKALFLLPRIGQPRHAGLSRLPLRFAWFFGGAACLFGCSLLVPLDGIFCEEGKPCAPPDGGTQDGRPPADAASGNGAFQVTYSTTELDAVTRRIRLEVQIVNRGDADVALSRMQLRYHFTIDGQEPAFLCNAVSDQPPSSCANVMHTIERQAQPTSLADHYLALNFGAAAGVLQGFGRSTGLMKLAILSTSGDFLQSNDHSFGGVAGEPYIWPKITLYLDGKLVFGEEPL